MMTEMYLSIGTRMRSIVGLIKLEKQIDKFQFVGSMNFPLYLLISMSRFIKL